MQRILTIDDAKITTVSVEIQALKIGTKQMTLSIFRQLRREPLIDRTTHKLCGLPWGKVHYQWDGCGMDWQIWDRGAAIHIIWQEIDQLRRDVIHKGWHQEHTSQGWMKLPGVPVELWKMVCDLPQLFIAV